MYAYNLGNISCVNLFYRETLYSDGMSELLEEEDIDLSVPLSVDFAEEMATDLGGPRRQFLGMMMREIKNRFFSDDGQLTELLYYKEKKHYYGIGLIIGKFF